MEAVYWRVTTSIVKPDWTYSITVISNYTDKEFRNCTYVQQPNFNTFPKVWDTVLLLIVANWEYAILGITSYNAKDYLSIGENEEIKIWETAWVTAINSTSILLTGTTITANWENLTIDNV